ncbi:PA3371 family protein [Pseudomonas orientalis]|uniref:PA3371 family protein n=1 Tax=Pseudomonas orientalis TaxID=76758 RepID=UPI000F56AF78|nr:PA3371 family protein [Pseudomonas orientalis]
MSKSAWLFLCLTLVTALIGLNNDMRESATLAFIASAVFGCLLILSLAIGRRIKFDPVLR